MPPAPWWHLLLVSGRDVLLESHANGWYVELRPTSGEAALLDEPHGRLRDLAGFRRRQTFAALTRIFAMPHRQDDAVAFNQRSERLNFFELRRGGEQVFSLRIEPEALDRLWPFQRTAFLLRDAPREGQLIIECHENDVRWRRLDAPSEPPTTGR